MMSPACCGPSNACWRLITRSHVAGRRARRWRWRENLPRMSPCSTSACPDRVALLIADAAGHGVSAAMLTGVVKSAFDASHAEHYEPLAVVRRMLAGIRDFEPWRYLTLFCAVLDRRRLTLDYVGAGHP